MRVYDLARQLDMPNKELVDKIRSLGIDVKSHSSSLDDESLRRVLQHFGKSVETLSPAPEKAVAELKEEPKKGTKKEKKSEGPKTAGQAVQPPKPPIDARAMALAAIARAKAKRAEHERQRFLEETEKDAKKSSAGVLAPQEVELGPKKPILKAPEPQTIVMPTALPARTEPASAKTAENAPIAAPPRGRAQPDRRQIRGDGSQPLPHRRSVELQQLPSLPKGRPGTERGRRGKEVDLVAPAIEVMKLRPSRRGAAGKRALTEKEEEAERERKRLLREKQTHGEKRIRPGRFLNIETIEEVIDTDVSVKRPLRIRPSAFLEKEKPRSRQTAVLEREPVVVKIRGDVTVAEFAEKIQVSPADIIGKAMEMGEILTMNKFVPTDLCELFAEEFKVRVEIIPESDDHDVQEFAAPDNPTQMRPRPPVVTVMGHVDHGKTTLLDGIRKTNVAAGEFGGITQRIGAYHVETSRGEIIFLDTPGHEAFTAMRARGASVTDIVILVVAADDGLMPQTVEAINHARAANVPIVVAINKIDLPTANVQKVRNALMQYGLVGEELGGDTIICEVSAKNGQGIDHLLEMVLLQAEVMELKADPDSRADGVVIESEIDPLRGINATILVRRGTFRVGSPFVCGDVSGRVRAMLDDLGRPIESASPSYPVRVLGLDGCPQVGERFLVVDSERQARQIAEVREARRRRQMQHAAERPHITLESLAELVKKDDKPKTLNLVLRADAQGSVEAVSQAIGRLSNPKVNIAILHSGVGSNTESDVQLAMASDAVVLGFNVRPDSAAADLAAQEKIEIKTYRVIYTLIEELQAAMLGMLDKKYREVPGGKAEIRQVFRISRLGNVAGCYVTSGSLARSDKARLVRDSVVVYDGSISSLRRVKDDVSSVQSGYECGLTLTDYQDIKEGDVVETYRFEEVAQVL